jgi:hypothetical protein
MRIGFVLLIRRLMRDRSHMYRYVVSAALQARSEIFLIAGVAIYEITDMAIRNKRNQLMDKMIQVKKLEQELKEKGISLE